MAGPEEIIVERIVHSAFPPGYKGYAVDVGACDGRYLSTTLELENRGWDVLCIEPNPLYSLKTYRKRTLEVAVGVENLDDQDFTVVTMHAHQGYWAACSALHVNQEVYDAHKRLIQGTEVIKVQVRTLDWCLEQTDFPRLDFLSVDTEGGDMDVLKGFDIAEWYPKVISVENWWNDERFTEYLKPFGYGARTTVGVNDIFIRQ
jgi:FkbM family methyltransferase